MFDDILAHLSYKIANAEVRPFPFPHIYVENVFSNDFYDQILTSLPSTEEYRGNEEGKYKNRKFNDATMAILEPLRTPDFTNICTYPFRHDIAKVHGGSFPASTDLRLVLDGENYSIGPHTDAKHKILSYLFYLPSDSSLEEHGTSIYVPKDPTFRCAGGPHHAYEGFTRIATMPFRPNSLFAFFKTSNSFHGVENITIPCRRDVLLWNLYKGK